MLAAALAAPSGARGEEVHCRAIAGGSPKLERLDAGVRLDFLRKNMRRGARRARIWHYGWTGIYGALTTYQAVAISWSDREQRINNYFGAGASFLGLSVLWIAPLKVMSDQKWLERRIAASPPGESPCALVAEAERLLERDAAGERFGKGPLTHAGNFLLNIGLALALGLGFNHWDQAAVQGLSGIAVGELQSFTQPIDEVRTLARYRSGDLSPLPGGREPPWLALVPTAARDGGGLALAVSF
jgi:hypothetical protein